MRIMALDMGAYQTTVCEYDTKTTQEQFSKIPATPAAIHDCIAKAQPERVVFEIGPQAGWVRDIAGSLGVEFQIANPNHEGWRWKKIKRKTDRNDALKLAQLSAMNQLR